MKELWDAINEIGRKAILRDIDLEVAEERYNGIRAVLSWKYARTSSYKVRQEIEKMKSVMDSTLASASTPPSIEIERKS